MASISQYLRAIHAFLFHTFSLQRSAEIHLKQLSRSPLKILMPPIHAQHDLLVATRSGCSCQTDMRQGAHHLSAVNEWRSGGARESKVGAKSAEHFDRFIHHLKRVGVDHVNIHFTSQSQACARGSGGVEYEYYLRIEDIAQWFPCWHEGLMLTEFTSRGWLELPHGSVYVGGDQEWQDRLNTETHFWWYPPGTAGCEDIYYNTRVGWQPGDWDGLSTGGAHLPVPY